MNTIFVSVRPEETRMGTVEEDRLRDYAVERSSNDNLVGNVYRARVCNVVPGIQAAFVDLNTGKNGFLTLKKGEKLSEGQMLLVQVVKDARGNKGPAVTREITLPGRYVVLEPYGSRVSLSRKISCKTKRKELREWARELLPENMGLVLRTAAAHAEESEIRADLEQLLRNWEVLVRRSKVGRGPQLLYRELDLAIRLVRDYVTDRVERIIVDDEKTCQRLQEMLRDMGLPQIQVKLYKGKEDLFTFYRLDEDIESLSDRVVWLPGGGYLVFDYTEAMTVIDVNSGKFSTGADRDATSMATNREAAREIARQLRLRDIGGIIVADFIDMDREEEQGEILQILKKEFAWDKMKPKVIDLTHLNLVEMTRMKARKNLSSILYTTCPMCGGSGRVEAPETVYVEIRRRLRSLFLQGKMSHSLMLTVHPVVYGWLRQQGLGDMEREFHCTLKLASDPSLEIGVFTLLTADQEGTGREGDRE
ncbi:Rne/Rng family ribonuclease [uncultured Acidaminococcus sp.]|uniref:Rne/Rng family ribonuclease n=1 Tax=uncultured Acidaminococcus sp. TaxID=352152 RepID=UPI002942E93C|nr:Rne/Rng family ribonuclease [uncultured Acidaminococcus sp.]